MLLALSTLAPAHFARAAPGSQSFLSWSAPSGCSSAEAVYGRVSQRVGYALERGRFSFIHGAIVEAGSSLELTLEFEENGKRSQRVLRAQSCDDLEGAAAVAIGLALGEPPGSGEVSAAKAAPSVPLDAVDRSPAEGSPEPAAVRAPIRLVPSLALQGVFDLGSLSRPGVGLVLEGRVRRDRWEFGLALSWLPEVERSVRPGESVAFGLLAAGPRVCYRPLDGTLSLGVCGSAEVGRFSASGEHLSESGRDLVQWWLAPGLGLELGARLGVGLRATLRGEALRPLIRKEYTINGAESVYSAAELAARLGAGIEVSLD